MQIAKALACPVAPAAPSQHGLRQLFDWYTALSIPYETLSNIEQDVLIKDAAQMLAAVQAGDGGHCVEHSVLFAALLAERGFDATLVNADYHDYQRQLHVSASKPLVLVQLEEGAWVCDPYYRGIVLPLPREGTLAHGTFVTARTADGNFSIERHQRGRVADEDRADLARGIDYRRRQFETRYQHFSPFGVTAPLFQLMRPVRKAVFYSPRRDRLIVAEADTYQVADPDDLPAIAWLPESFHARIGAVLPMLRAQRAHARTFLETGLFPPYYERLREAGVVYV
jgi:hypothetical protein